MSKKSNVQKPETQTTEDRPAALEEKELKAVVGGFTLIELLPPPKTRSYTV